MISSVIYFPCLCVYSVNYYMDWPQKWDAILTYHNGWLHCVCNELYLGFVITWSNMTKAKLTGGLTYFELMKRHFHKTPSMSSLFQLMAWCRIGDKLLPELTITQLLGFSCEYLIKLNVYSAPSTLKRKCHHFDEIFITGCTESCHFDNSQCSQWWKFHQNEDISVTVHFLNQ